MPYLKKGEMENELRREEIELRRKDTELRSFFFFFMCHLLHAG